MKKATNYQALSDRYDQLMASGYRDKQPTHDEFERSMVGARKQHDATLKALLGQYLLEDELEEALRDMHYYAQLGTAAFTRMSAKSVQPKSGPERRHENLIIKAIVLILLVNKPAKPWDAMSARGFSAMICETMMHAGLVGPNDPIDVRTVQRRLKEHSTRSKAVQRYEALASSQR